MAKLTQDCWNRHFLQEHKIFWPLLPFARDFVAAYMQWPTLADYQRLLRASGQTVQTVSGHDITFVPQDTKPARLEDSYEPRIYLAGEVQTRLQNWHDFFQVLVWRIFPRTKAVINGLHYHAIAERMKITPLQAQRSSVENALTQFDECGAVILSSNPVLLELIRDFQWQALFWRHRELLKSQLKCIVFGHAIYEKAINPYIGMTTHSVLLLVDNETLQMPTEELMGEVDAKLSQLFMQQDRITSPRDFSPFPLLGMPGWHPDNDNECFYFNQQYFRPGRKCKTGS